VRAPFQRGARAIFGQGKQGDTLLGLGRVGRIHGRELNLQIGTQFLGTALIVLAEVEVLAGGRITIDIQQHGDGLRRGLQGELFILHAQPEVGVLVIHRHRGIGGPLGNVAIHADIEPLGAITGSRRTARADGHPGQADQTPEHDLRNQGG